MKTRSAILHLSLGFLAVPFLLPASGGTSKGPNVVPGQVLTSRPRQPLRADFGNIPLQFIPNKGQKDDRVAYYIAGRDKTIYFTAEGLTYVLDGRDSKTGSNKPGSREASNEGHSEGWVVRLDFVKPKAKVKPVGAEVSGTVVSYFKGQPKEWKTGLAACSKIVYPDLWPGIDLMYSGSHDVMKYEFLVHPGADPTRIRLAYRGAEKVVLTTDGRLEARTPAGDIRDDRPLAYQEMSGMQRTVAVAYDLTGDTYGFRLGDYDRGRPLVLDPSVLIYCGYIGGEGKDVPQGIAVDAAGNAYIAGYTYSTESSFPVTVGPDLTFEAGDEAPWAAFVVKVNASGTGLAYCGYICGSEGAEASAIAVDALGNAYVTGSTRSPEAGFPVIGGPDLTFNGGELDAWVAKIDPTGTTLLYCGYIGGSASDGGRAIAIDGLGQAYIAGHTVSSAQSSFPVAVGPDLTFNGGTADAFVAKVNASGTALEYCGYVGGIFEDDGYGIAVDGSGCAYIAGYTQSYQDTFPVKVGPSLVPGSGFVAKVSASGGTLEYCGFVDGQCYAIAVDGIGGAYITGAGFVDKVKPDGTGLVYSVSVSARSHGIAVDAAGCAYITGESGGSLSPLTAGPDLTFNGTTDAFVAKVDASGTAFEYCGYIGGKSPDEGKAIAIDGAGNAYVTGTTSSLSGAPWYFPAILGPDLTYNGGAGDGFVAKVPPDPVAPPLPVLTAVSPDNCLIGTPEIILTVEGAHLSEGDMLKWCREDGFAVAEFPTTFIDSTKLQATIDRYYLGSPTLVLIKVVNGNGEVSNPLAFTVNNPLPTLASISPTAVTGGGPPFPMTLTGTNFVGVWVIRWNGVDMAECRGGGTEVWVEVPSSQIATGGEAEITVYIPPPGGGTSNPLILTVSTFSLNPSPATATVNAGQSATFPIELAPQLGSFDAEVAFVNGNLPKACRARFSPASVTPGAGTASTTLTVTTEARSVADAGLAGGWTGLIPPILGFIFASMLLLSSFRSRQRPRPRLLPQRWLVAAVLVCLAIAVARCGGGSGGDNNPTKGTPAGTYEIIVAGRSGSMTVSTTLTLIVR